MIEFETSFTEACHAYRTARAKLEAADVSNRAAWEQNPHWRSAWDLHADITSRFPGEVAVEVIDAFYPELMGTIARITAHRDAHIVEREVAYEALHVARSGALNLLGNFFGQRIVDTNPEPHELEEAIEDAFSSAQSMRKLSLDGLRLAFDADGPFTKALFAKVAGYLDIPVRGRRWIYEVTQAMRSANPHRAPGF